uniref:Uncharacterized protein n=1 Tax=Romanomermis culicivorax TaxID=13658 RepID=A0A915JPI9_ROMCU
MKFVPGKNWLAKYELTPSMLAEQDVGRASPSMLAEHARSCAWRCSASMLAELRCRASCGTGLTGLLSGFLLGALLMVSGGSFVQRFAAFSTGCTGRRCSSGVRLIRHSHFVGFMVFYFFLLLSFSFGGVFVPRGSGNGLAMAVNVQCRGAQWLWLLNIHWNRQRQLCSDQWRGCLCDNWSRLSDWHWQRTGGAGFVGSSRICWIWSCSACK